MPSPVYEGFIGGEYRQMAACTVYYYYCYKSLHLCMYDLPQCVVFWIVAT
jgi:hypothetical protein